MINRKVRGFTLIELLVVIAIIGILAALVLVALGNARDKANDARIKANIGQLRTLAEIIYFTADSSYDNGTISVQDCFTSPGTNTCGDLSTASSVTNLKADILEANSSASFNAESSATSYCVHATTLNNKRVCIDNSGETHEGPAYTCDPSPMCSGS